MSTQPPVFIAPAPAQPGVHQHVPGVFVMNSPEAWQRMLAAIGGQPEQPAEPEAKQDPGKAWRDLVAPVTNTKIL